MLRGGVAGFGWAGQDLVKRIRRKYADRVEIVAACNRGEERRKIARDEFGLRVTGDVREMCGWGLDFVAVMSTSFAHKEQVLAAADANLAIFCEKPIALTLEDADEMIAAVESRGLVNVVNYSLRYAPAYARIRQWVEEGYFGPIRAICSDRWRGRDFWVNGMRYKVLQRPEEFGTWLVHHMCHSLDLVYWLAGPFQEIYCVTDTTKPDSTDEEVMWSVGRLASGATFAVSDAASGQVREHFGLQGLKRSLVMEATGKPARVFIKEEGKELQVGEPVELAPPDKVSSGVDHLMEVLLEGKPSRATLRDARHSLAAAIAAKKSSLQNRPVRLEEVEPPASQTGSR